MGSTLNAVFILVAKGFLTNRGCWNRIVKTLATLLSPASSLSLSGIRRELPRSVVAVSQSYIVFQYIQFLADGQVN